MTEEKRKRDIDIKPTQVIAAALAAVTAAFLGSRLGVAGTVTGAGIASIVSTVGSALYQHSLDRTSKTLRSKVESARTAEHRAVSASPETVTTGSAAEAPTRRLEPTDPNAKTEVMRKPTVGPPADRSRGLNWKVLLGATVAVFVVGMGVITGIELLSGGPISGGNEGTSIGGLFGGSTERPSVPRHHDPTTSSAPTTTGTPTPTTAPQAPPTGTSTPPTTTTAPPTTTTPSPTTTTGPPVTPTDGAALPTADPTGSGKAQ